MIRFQGMRHLALKVADVERAARFYEKAFGMRRFGPSKRGGDLIPLVSPNLKDQISLSSAANSGETERRLGQPGEHGGFDHFGFIVSPGTRLEDVKTRLLACGATFLGAREIAKNAPSLFFKDLDGYVFQVTRFPRFTRLYIALLPLIGWLQRRRRGR